MFKEHYNHIKTQLQDLEDIKVFGWYLNQDEQKGGILNCPAVFVKFETAQITALSKFQQEVILEGELILFTDFKKANSKIADDGHVHVELMDAIRALMYCFEEIGLSPMQKDNGLIRSSVLLRHKFVQKRAKKPVTTISSGDFSPDIVEDNE